MKLEYRFITEGAVIKEIEPNAIYVDVGSISHPFVFDHHAGKENEIPASMIWEAREFLSELGKTSGHLIIYTHDNPCWNACWGVCVLKWILEGKQIDERRVKSLNTYSGFILSGFNPSEGAVEKSLIAVYESLMAEIESSEKTPEFRDIRKIETSLDFFQFCYDEMEDYASLKTGSFLSEDGNYGKYMLIVKEDFQAYLRDLQNAFRFQAVVYHKTGEPHRVDGLKMNAPNSRLFKFWARSDREHSYSKAGFPMMWIQWEPRQWIISVNPATGYILKGLGDFLTNEECKINPQDQNQNSREHYDCPNPWYDARKTLSEFTIVASPQGGTKISPEKIVRLLRKFLNVKKWRPAVEKPSFTKDRLIPYGIPALSLIGVLLIGWVVFFHPAQKCDKWADLKQIDTAKGRHIAVVIGINDYSKSKGWDSLKTPVKDAENIMELLTQKYRFESLSENNTGSVLMVSDGKISPTFSAIKNQIRETAASMTPEDSLLIYFAGHGQMDQTFGYWIPNDFQDKATTIEHVILQEILQKSNARHILIIADCCYAGKIVDTGEQRGQTLSWKTQHVKPSANVHDLYQKPSRQAITSGNLEPVPDGNGNSPFAASLIRVLEKNRKPYITARDIFQEILDLSGINQEAKKPFLFVVPDTCDMQGEFVFRLIE